MIPTKDTALQFAIMLSAGMPASDAIVYFLPADTQTGEVTLWLRKWLGSAMVQSAIRQVQGKEWQEMSLEERIKFAVNKHYTEMAYYLYSHNYSDLTGADKTKADTCRSTLEAKLAGMSGKLDALSAWWEEVRTGRTKLPGVSAAGVAS